MDSLVLHGHRRAYYRCGEGPLLLLLHGLGCDATTWLPVLPRLATRFTVIAPDLLGHGRSDKPRADYSLGGYANGMRDLITVLGFDRATVVGHSFGGGVAMQFAYQFPERTERLALVAPGGLGAEVSWAVRALTLPGMGAVIGAATRPVLRPAVAGALRGLARTGLPHTQDLGEVAGIYEQMADPTARSAIRHVVRAVVDWRGQVVTMTDRAYLTRQLPTCVVWGVDDDVIPVGHAAEVRASAPDAQVHVLRDAAHFPHRDHPDRFAEIITDFVAGTRPASYRRARFRSLLARGDIGLTPVADRAEAG
ncbi:MAG: alpha/beta fold hydrolase [Nocardioidaceae bacterium]|jgi:pimeloyl-ACP methyl ester carboxylesterase|nr:alpha/beta fold hydrolase [Nocardioidaceae bacterium]